MAEGLLGQYRKVDAGVLADDPFWSRVRQRHPDVEVVLVPPAGDARRTAVPPELVRQSADRVLEAWGLLRPLLAAAGATEPPSVRWGSRELSDDRVALVVEKAVRGIGPDGGRDLLRAATVVLGEAGWRLSPSRRDGLPLLRATDGGVDLEAVAGPGATTFTIASGLLDVATADREIVVDEARQVVASWA